MGKKEQIQGRLRDASERVLMEHPKAEMAIVIMTSTQLEGNGFQVSQRIPVTRASHAALANTLRMCADEIERQGPPVPAGDLS